MKNYHYFLGHLKKPLKQPTAPICHTKYGHFVEGSYTNQLLGKGINRVTQKVGEAGLLIGSCLWQKTIP